MKNSYAVYAMQFRKNTVKYLQNIYIIPLRAIYEMELLSLGSTLPYLLQCHMPLCFYSGAYNNRYGHRIMQHPVDMCTQLALPEAPQNINDLYYNIHHLHYETFIIRRCEPKSNLTLIRFIWKASSSYWLLFGLWIFYGCNHDSHRWPLY